VLSLRLRQLTPDRLAKTATRDPNNLLYVTIATVAKQRICAERHRYGRRSDLRSVIEVPNLKKGAKR